MYDIYLYIDYLWVDLQRIIYENVVQIFILETYKGPVFGKDWSEIDIDKYNVHLFASLTL